VVFDQQDTPSRALIDACVHCGFCLPTCPTYALWGEEMDSPRGRIYLMKAGLEERTEMSPSFVQHFDTCLGCMACVTACPSGVQYAPLIEATRGQIERKHDRPLGDRLFRSAIFAIFPHPARLRLALAPLVLLGSWIRRLPLPARLRDMLSLAPKVTWSSMHREVPERTPAIGERRMTIGLLTGCVQRVMFGHVNQATARVLAAEGCDVVAPNDQECCGALALHAGRLDEARAFARRTIDTFERAGVESIAVNAAGCGSSMKEYGHLLADDPAWAERARVFSARVRDVSEIVSSLAPARAIRHPMPLRVAYHDACHLAHAQGVRQPPRDLLRSIPGVELVPFAEQDICCGSAGIYNLVEPEAARQLGDRKLGHAAAVAPDVVATGNPGCILQISAAAERAGTPMRVLHPVELLDASIRGQAVVD
jgi:glycolate oxidase iron-sulfur subunit